MMSAAEIQAVVTRELGPDFHAAKLSRLWIVMHKDRVVRDGRAFTLANAIADLKAKLPVIDSDGGTE